MCHLLLPLGSGRIQLPLKRFVLGFGGCQRRLRLDLGRFDTLQFLAQGRSLRFECFPLSTGSLEGALLGGQVRLELPLPCLRFLQQALGAAQLVAPRGEEGPG